MRRWQILLRLFIALIGQTPAGTARAACVAGWVPAPGFEGTACMPQGATNCGSGLYCWRGQRCTGDGGCTPPIAGGPACGDSFCRPGETCGSCGAPSGACCFDSRRLPVEPRPASNKTPSGRTNALFGIPSNPDNPQLSPSNQRQAVTVPTVRDQAASAAKDAQSAKKAHTIEAAKEMAGCEFDVAPCQKGDPVTLPKIGGKPSIQASVFPGISHQDWNKLQSTESGRALIKQADDLVSRRTKLERTIDEIRSGGYTRQEDWIAADKELQSANKELSGYQKKAQDLIRRTVLEP
jgi:hypothetical protein